MNVRRICEFEKFDFRSIAVFGVNFDDCLRIAMNVTMVTYRECDCEDSHVNSE